MSHTLRIAHLSDLHFSHISFSLNQFRSKRWIGNLNLILFRRHYYETEHLGHIPELLDALKVDVAFITGDFSSTSLKEEFSLAQDFIKKFKLPVFVLPGNHDCYTRACERKKTYYDYFSTPSMKEKRIEVASLGKGWWWVALDCTIATAPFVSNGKFFEHMEETLEKILSEIPTHENVIMGNHFPLFRFKGISHDLMRIEALQRIVKKYPQVKIYLHGHDHKPYIIDKTKEGFPLVLNAGSCAHRPDGTFYMLDLFENECLVQQLFYVKDQNSDAFTWVVKWQQHYNFPSSLA